MGMRIKTKGNFNKLEKYLKKAKEFDPMPILERYGEIGVEELRNATPVRTGLTAASWYYQIVKEKDTYTIQWLNSNVSNGVSVAVIIQLGHTTRTGTYVPPNDFITPAIEKVFERLSIQVWQEVSG